MIDRIVYCATTHHTDDCHTPDQCAGCEDRPADHGILCRRCHQAMLSLIGPDVPVELAEPGAESVATVTAWLSDNLGQHLRGRTGNPAPGGDPAERTAAVATALVDLQIKLWSWADNLREDHGWRTGPRDSAPATIAEWFRHRIPQLAAWPPVAVMIEDLRDTIDAAHAVAPWRARDRPCPGVACPHCHQTTLTIPAGWIDVQCRSCGAIHGRDVYDRLAVVAAWEANTAQKLERAGLGPDTLATLTDLHHALEIPRRTLERWALTDKIVAVACQLVDRSRLYVALDAAAYATRVRHRNKWGILTDGDSLRPKTAQQLTPASQP